MVGKEKNLMNKSAKQASFRYGFSPLVDIKSWDVVNREGGCGFRAHFFVNYFLKLPILGHHRSALWDYLNS